MNGNMMLLTNSKHSISACTINYLANQALVINDILDICHFFPSATEETPFASHSRIGVLLYPRKINHQPIFTRYHRTSPRICGSDTTPLCSSRAVMVNLDPWKVVSGENFVFAGGLERTRGGTAVACGGGCVRRLVLPIWHLLVVKLNHEDIPVCLWQGHSWLSWLKFPSEWREEHSPAGNIPNTQCV